MKLLSFFKLALLSTFAFSATAEALTWKTGYICEVNPSKQNNVSYGQGYIQVKLNSEPRCLGNSLGTVYYRGKGGSVGGFEFSADERLQLTSILQNHAIAGRKVKFGVSNANGVFHNYFFASE